MLRIHRSDGATLKVDLFDEEQVDQWLEQLRDLTFQTGITGITLCHKGVQYSLVRPQGFRNVTFAAEPVHPDLVRKIKGAERIVCSADDVQISIVVHREQRAVRVTFAKIGRQRYNPILNGRG